VGGKRTRKEEGITDTLNSRKEKGGCNCSKKKKKNPECYLSDTIEMRPKKQRFNPIKKRGIEPRLASSAAFDGKGGGEGGKGRVKRERQSVITLSFFGH